MALSTLLITLCAKMLTIDHDVSEYIYLNKRQAQVKS
ncbi:hypothetical protein CI610_02683 [invertebrate metagenome]|uniref:Uncharacterized protein n=1 Tax=invertebrate metagenome TaxID=1711999 RepID=A0A2H9T596_9ZZZZ